MEIERKYLIKEMPALSQAKSIKKIEQGYVSTSPVVRIRKSNDDFILTCKGKGLMAREEFELTLEPHEYQHLKNKIDHQLIKKTRYLFDYGNHTIELDIFEGHLQGLTLAEVEFDSIDAANTFVPPSWFGKDVTMDRRYHNSHMVSLSDANTLIDPKG